MDHLTHHFLGRRCLLGGTALSHVYIPAITATQCLNKYSPACVFGRIHLTSRLDRRWEPGCFTALCIWLEAGGREPGHLWVSFYTFPVHLPKGYCGTQQRAEMRREGSAMVHARIRTVTCHKEYWLLSRWLCGFLMPPSQSCSLTWW